MEDKEIISLFLARDEKAIEETQAKYGRRLKGLAYQLTQDLYAAEECENDTYLSTWNLIPPNEPCDHFYPFLAKTARNTALRFLRDKNRLKRKADLEELSTELQMSIPGNMDIDRFLEESSFQKLLNDFLQRQKPEKRNIFLRRYWYLDSIKTISDGYGISESKVKVTLYRLREELRKELEREGYIL